MPPFPLFWQLAEVYGRIESRPAAPRFDLLNQPGPRARGSGQSYPKGPKAPAGDWARTGSGTALVLAPRPAGHPIPARPFQPPSLRRRRKRKLKAKPRESHEDGRTSHPPRASETQRKRTHPPTPVGIEPASPIRLAPVAAVTAALAPAITAALGAVPPPGGASPLAVCPRPASPANVVVAARAGLASPARVEIAAREGLVAAVPLAALTALATLAILAALSTAADPRATRSVESAGSALPALPPEATGTGKPRPPLATRAPWP